MGKPNVGKTTFFNACTLSKAEIANYPFTTISSNVGICYATSKCVCQELKVKCNPQNSKCLSGVRLIPVKIIDVAGLVEDAHLGKGLGNRFLDDIMRAEVLIHIIDASGTTDSEGRPTKGHDPRGDVLFLEREIDEWFFSKLYEKFKKFKNKLAIEHLELWKVLPEKFGIVSEEDVRHASSKVGNDPFAWDDENLREFTYHLRRENKPIIIASNKADIASQENLENLSGIPCSAEAELALRNAMKALLIEYVPGASDFKIVGRLTDKQESALERIRGYLERHDSTGVQDCINKAIFEILERIVVYPVENEHRYTDSVGNVLPDAYLMRKGSTAHDLAYKIHTELGEKFIHAVNAKTKMRVKEDYELQHRDVIKIVSAAR